MVSKDMVVLPRRPDMILGASDAGVGVKPFAHRHGVLIIAHVSSAPELVSELVSFLQVHLRRASLLLRLPASLTVLSSEKYCVTLGEEPGHGSASHISFLLAPDMNLA